MSPHSSPSAEAGQPRCATLRAPTETAAELEASRARIIAAVDEARSRLERDLHDGAQQLFVGAALTLTQAVARAHGTPAEALVAEAFEQLQQGLAALRDLARGLHPAVLTERGLAAALEGVVHRSPVPVELRATHERASAPVEAAIYFTVAEALTNVAKHAHATLASVQVDIENGMLVASVSDDGAGGASIAGGSGLQGLADRLAALGGTLTVVSPVGHGTFVRASLPHDELAGSQPLAPGRSGGAAGADELDCRCTGDEAVRARVVSDRRVAVAGDVNATTARCKEGDP
jgi:signal transduction histidine kinase